MFSSLLELLFFVFTLVFIPLYGEFSDFTSYSFDNFKTFKLSFFFLRVEKKPLKMSKVSRDTILESVNQVLELSKAKERKFLETIELQVCSFDVKLHMLQVIINGRKSPILRIQNFEKLIDFQESRS